MKKTYRVKQNLFNEALIIATKAFKYTDDTPLIDYSKLNISQKQFEEKYPNLVKYYETIKLESLRISNEYKDLYDLIKEEDNYPSIFNTLVFSKMKNSISNYEKNEFVDGLKAQLIINVTYRTGQTDLSNDIDNLVLVDQLEIYDNSQKYALLKLLNNTAHTLDRFFEYILKLESILEKYFYLIEPIFMKIFEDIQKVNIFELDDINAFQSQSMFHLIKETEVMMFINQVKGNGLSVTIDNDQYIAMVFVSLIQFIIKDHRLNLEDTKDSIQKRLSVLSDSTRFSILYYLSQKKAFGKEISDALNISKGTVSYHLNSLVEENLLQIEIEGKKIYYCLNLAGFKEIVVFLNSLIGEKNEAKNI